MFQTLSTSDTVLLVCDIQGCFRETIYGFTDVVDTTAFLLKGARILQLPCIVTEQYPERLQHTVDSLLPYINKNEDEKQEAYPVFAKVSFSMCTEEVSQYLESLSQVKNIIICGMETHVCVYQTCIDLVNKGYSVHLCVDAVSSRSPIDRKVAIAQLQQIGVHLITAENAMFQFIQSKNHPQFKAISALVKGKSLPSKEHDL